MALRVRFQFTAGAKLGISIEQLSTGLKYDFGTNTFVAAPAAEITPIVEGSGIYSGCHALTMTATPPAIFTDGDYCVYIHKLDVLALEASVQAILACTMFNGDDATVFPVRYFKVTMLGQPHQYGQ